MKFYCYADEFYFCKLYSLCRGENELTGESKRITKSGMIKVGSLFVSVFVLGIIYFFITEKVLHDNYKLYANLVMAIVIISIFVNVFVILSRLGKEKELLYKNAMNDPRKLNERVMLYEIDDEGIFFNEFNTDHKSHMTLVPWRKIKNATVGKLTYPAIVSASDGGRSTFNQRKELLREAIREVREKHNDFDYSVQLEYEDKKGIHFYFHNGLYYEYLAIPDSVNEQEFVGVLGQYIDVEYEKEFKPINL